MISHFCKHQAKTRHNASSASTKHLYVMLSCCQCSPSCVCRQNIVEFELAMFANEGIISK